MGTRTIEPVIDECKFEEFLGRIAPTAELRRSQEFKREMRAWIDSVRGAYETTEIPILDKDKSKAVATLARNLTRELNDYRLLNRVWGWAGDNRLMVQASIQQAVRALEVANPILDGVAKWNAPKHGGKPERWRFAVSVFLWLCKSRKDTPHKLWRDGVITSEAAKLGYYALRAAGIDGIEESSIARIRADELDNFDD